MKLILKNLHGQWRELGYSIALGSFALSASVGLLACSAWLISMASTRPPVLILEVAIVAVRFFGLSRGVFRYFGRILEHNSALNIQTNLRISIYEKVSGLLPTTLLEYKRGAVMQQIVSDVEGVQDIWLRLAAPWITGFISGIAGLAIIYALLPSLALILTLLFIATALISPILAALSQSALSQRANEAELFAEIMQGSESVNESIIYGYQEKLFNQIELLQDSLTVTENRAAKWSGVASAFNSSALGISLITSAIMAASAYSRGALAGVNVAVLILLPLAIFDGLSTLPVAFVRTKRALDSAKSLEPILKIQSPWEIEKIHIQDQFCELRIESVRPLIGGRELPIFNGVAHPGHPLIIMGKSGLGKSSLLNSILGFIEFTGNISVNGVSVKDIEKDLFATLLQDDYLFNTSIRENLKIGSSDASDSQLMEVLSLVELDGLVNSLEQGLDTVIGTFGYNFSGGEKQRFKLARVLLRKSQIFLLDEPFEFLESEQADRIATKVNEYLASRTVVIISHLPLPLAI